MLCSTYPVFSFLLLAHLPPSALAVLRPRGNRSSSGSHGPPVLTATRRISRGAFCTRSRRLSSMTCWSLLPTLLFQPPPHPHFQCPLTRCLRVAGPPPLTRAFAPPRCVCCCRRCTATRRAERIRHGGRMLSQIISTTKTMQLCSSSLFFSHTYQEQTFFGSRISRAIPL
jgi:hypothetical protein